MKNMTRTNITIAYRYSYTWFRDPILLPQNNKVQSTIMLYCYVQIGLQLL